MGAVSSKMPSPMRPSGKARWPIRYCVENQRNRPPRTMPRRMTRVFQTLSEVRPLSVCGGAYSRSADVWLVCPMSSLFVGGSDASARGGADSFDRFGRGPGPQAEQVADPLLDLCHQRIAFAPRFARGTNLNGFADAHDGGDGGVGADLVSEVLLEALDRFQEPLRLGVRRDVVGRVVGDLLSDIDVGQVQPATLPLGVGDGVVDHVGQDGGAEALDAGDDVRLARTFQPFPFQGIEDRIQQVVEALAEIPGLGLAHVLDFLERDEPAADAEDALLERQVRPPAPAQAVLDLVEHWGDGLVDVAVE